jgi:hypothetical protein
MAPEMQQQVRRATAHDSRAQRELSRWYGTRLRPKLVAAARAGTISGRQAVELDLQLRELVGHRRFG